MDHPGPIGGDDWKQGCGMCVVIAVVGVLAIFLGPLIAMAIVAFIMVAILFGM